MDVLDRIAALLRAVFGDADATGRRAGSFHETGSPRGPSQRPLDPDLAAAWDELNAYLGDESGERRGTGPGADRRADARGPGGPRTPPEALRSDYANLEVAFGADIDTVRRSYKRLVLRYHPDRQGGDPEKIRIATEITKKVNESFERIRSFQERSGPFRR
jgi:hypothetical protein